MGKENTLGKIILASTIALSGIGLSMNPSHTNASNVVAYSVHFEEQATKFLQSAIDGDWDTAHSLLSVNLKPLPKETLKLMWDSFTSPYGAVKEKSLKGSKNNGVHTRVITTITAEKGSYELVLNLDQQGNIDDFSTAASYPPGYFLSPEYNNPNNYFEKQVVIGEGTFSLPGVLTVPKGEGPFPVVVLVHGSGPNDMDSTAYAFKPFRDIAQGLANEGIAVLRYDKRTNVHPIKFTLNPAFTIHDETVADANLAVEKMKTLPEIDPDNIFVLAHSQGAYALPLIFKNDKNGDIKGGIGVAGPAGTFQDLFKWQLEQQVERVKNMNAPAEAIEAAKQQLAAFQQQYDIINNPELTTENLPPELLGLKWFIDIRDYKAPNLAKEQDVPLLIVQGEKDIQVPVSHFNEWKTTLQNRKNVQFKLYPNMIHTITNFEGQPNLLSEYTIPANVPSEFLSDVTEWVKTGKVSVNIKEYKDYKENQYWSEAYSWAVKEGFIKGFNGNLLKPHESIKESHLLNVLFRYTLGENFKDESLDSIYSLSKDAGLPVKEKANAFVSRGEAAVILAHILTNEVMSEKEAVALLYDKGIIEGYQDAKGHTPKSYESFKPEEALSRVHLVTMLHRIEQNK